MSLPQQILTGGEFETEALAWEHFDSVLGKCQAFAVHKEVRGEYLQPRLATEDKTARIDRILIPRKEAIDAGWTDGAIGIEGKRSNMKVGRLISQAMDYSRCVWELDRGVPGLLLMLRWVFIFPSDTQFGDVASIMCQNRIGYVTHYNRSISFNVGAQHGIVINDDGSIRTTKLAMGGKRGSR